MPVPTIATAAADGFKLLVRQYKQPDIFSGNFWFGGNSLHTCLDYLINSKTTDAETQILPFAFDVYRGMASDTGWWRDDYGWWGESFVLALNNRGALGYGASTYDGLFMAIEGAAECCWRQMYADWSDLEYGVPNDHAAGTSKIRGGVFNIPVTAPSQTMQGRNCVTNEGYWLLSLGLAQRNPKSQWFSAQASAIQGWFMQWLGIPPGIPGILNPAGLVLERPLGNKSAPAWYWSGDQGLLALALFRSNADRNRAVGIVKQTITNMAKDHGFLHENLGFVDAGLGEFLADYATGKGIFMRSLVEINAGSGNQFDAFIKQNAAAVWGTRDVTSNQFTFNWNLASGYEPPFLRVDGKTVLLCNLIMQAAGQDALNAALRISPNAEIADKLADNQTDK
jgi:hypothetical protein